MNTQYWKGPGAPIFLMVGGEGEISPGYVTAFNYVEFAKKEVSVVLVIMW